MELLNEMYELLMVYVVAFERHAKLRDFLQQRYGWYWDKKKDKEDSVEDGEVFEGEDPHGDFTGPGGV